ncbi:MAG: tyrosine-type recombinase/integrase [Deltaproteobacteria bacterium]|nr:tyrosine-type recombinase/integrase [Deltaproteobacteria bacterium]
MSVQETFASGLGPIIAGYLTLKRALGRRYAVERDVLAHIDRFLAADAQELTAETFANWCATLAHLKPGVRRNRMRIVRNLCLYRRRSEPSCFVPDLHGFPRPHAPRPPHFFTEQEICRLLRATDALRPSPISPLHREVYRLAIVLLHTAGLRRGELVRLTLADYEPAEKVLHVRATKFHKSRLVPLSSDAAREMEAYFQARRRLPHAADAPLLCSRCRGLRPYTGAGLAKGLRRLFQSANVRTASGRLPRVHDMRHSFALHALLRWYRVGIDVQAKLPALAAYMGHVSIVSTQCYLPFIEPLAQAASERFARHCAPFLATCAAGGGGR